MKRIAKEKGTHIGRVLTPQLKPCGHIHTRLTRNKKTTTHLVHKLMLEAFVGPCPPNMVSRHLDGNGANNCLSNVVYGTRSQNVFDDIKHGNRVDTKGSHHGNSKLSEEMIPKIRSLLEHGYTQKEIGRMFKVGRTTIQKIKNGSSWKHVK